MTPPRGILRGFKVALDVQHLFRSDRPKDRGVRFARPGGVTIDETDCSTCYAAVAAGELSTLGAEVLTNDPAAGRLVGGYASRGREAIAWGAHVFVACHVNAGGGTYALVLSRADQPVAAIVARLLEREVDRLGAAFPFPLFTERKRSPLLAGAGDRGFACLAGMVPGSGTLGVVFEPFFGDSLRHAPLLEPDGLARVGLALARGLVEWWAVKKPDSERRSSPRFDVSGAPDLTDLPPS